LLIYTNNSLCKIKHSYNLQQSFKICINNFIDAERQKHFRNYRCRLQLFSNIVYTNYILYWVNNSNYCSPLGTAQFMHLMNFLVRDKNSSTFDRMFTVTAASVITSSVFCRTTQTTVITTLSSVSLSDSAGKIMTVGALFLVLGVITMRHPWDTISP